MTWYNGKLINIVAIFTRLNINIVFIIVIIIIIIMIHEIQ